MELRISKFIHHHTCILQLQYLSCSSRATLSSWQVETFVLTYFVIDCSHQILFQFFFQFDLQKINQRSNSDSLQLKKEKNLTIFETDKGLQTKILIWALILLLRNSSICIWLQTQHVAGIKVWSLFLSCNRNCILSFSKVFWSFSLIIARMLATYLFSTIL